MLSDPLPVMNAMTVARSGGTPLNFRRISDGRYTCVEAPFSLDQPARVSITPTIKSEGYSTVRFMWEQAKNVVGVPTLPDDIASVSLVVKYNPRSHSQTEVGVAVENSTAIFMAFLGRLMSGER